VLPFKIWDPIETLERSSHGSQNGGTGGHPMRDATQLVGNYRLQPLCAGHQATEASPDGSQRRLTRYNRDSNKATPLPLYFPHGSIRAEFHTAEKLVHLGIGTPLFFGSRPRSCSDTPGR
jgi:hypothetical protein